MPQKAKHPISIDDFTIPVPTVIVELTNKCNLHCPLCSTANSMKRKKGYMEFSFFKKILAELKEWSPKSIISMNMCGEPLMHPQAPEFVKEAASNNFKTFICTNGTFCNQQIAEKLADSGLSKIAFCIDGASSESHQAYRIGSFYDKIKKNTELFVETIDKKEQNRPEVIVQTLLTSHSENELTDILSWAWNINIDEVHFKTLSLGSHISKEQREKYKYLLPKNPELRRTYSNESPNCSYPLNHFMIFWDGSLGLCCIDFDNEINLPQVQSKSLKEIFNSQLMIDARMKGCLREWGLCKKCQSTATKFQGFRIPVGEIRKGFSGLPDKSYFINLIDQFIKKAHDEN